jgi:EthD domain
MVTLLCFLKRKDGTTHDEFVDHWHNRHGPLLRSTESMARHIVRYEQHSPSTDAEGFGTEGFDGMTLMSFRSMDGFKAFLDEPDYMELIYPDEDRFLDRHALVWMVADDPVVVIDGDG